MIRFCAFLLSIILVGGFFFLIICHPLLLLGAFSLIVIGIIVAMVASAIEELLK